MKKTKFTELCISVRTEKIELVKEFCRKNRYAFSVEVVNIPESEIAEFNKFLIDNEVLDE